jgi:hypothetical protein
VAKMAKPGPRPVVNRCAAVLSELDDVCQSEIICVETNSTGVLPPSI